MERFKACVIGWPIGHSRSPLIHNYWLKHYEIAGDYVAQAVAPEDLQTFLGEMQASGWLGGNVTLPHKERVLALCDVATPLARRVGAVNTLWFENGRLHGDNTDVGGFLANLDDQQPGWSSGGGDAVVIGAGGAARAIVAGLVERKFGSILILNRSLARAQALAEEARSWGAPKVEAALVTPDADCLKQASFLVNTTSLGMKGQPKLEIDLSFLPSEALVSDIVYSPAETDLLRAARERGLNISTGLGMLLYQAAPGFQHWFGVLPKVTSQLRALVEANVEQDSQ